MDLKDALAAIHNRIYRPRHQVVREFTDAITAFRPTPLEALQLIDAVMVAIDDPESCRLAAELVEQLAECVERNERPDYPGQPNEDEAYERNQGR